MNATYTQNQTRFPVALLLLVLAAILAITFVAQPQVWKSLGLTRHAQQSHSEQTLNANSIQAHFLVGKCTPSQYACADQRQIAWCLDPKDSSKAIGLVISTVTQRIITGFRADKEYWRGACK